MSFINLYSISQENVTAPTDEVIEEVFQVADDNVEVLSNNPEEISQSIDTGIDAAEVIADEIQMTEEATDKGEEAALAVENLIRNVTLAQATDTYSAVHADAVNQMMQYIASDIGYPNVGEHQLSISQETFNGFASATLSTELSLQGLKNFGKAIVEAIVRAIEHIVEFIRELFVQVFSNFDKIHKYAEVLSKEVNKLPEGETAGKLGSLSRFLVIDGKAPKSAEDIVNAIQTTSRDIMANWRPQDAGKAAAEKIGELENIAKTDMAEEELVELTHNVSARLSKNELITLMPFSGSKNILNGTKYDKYQGQREVSVRGSLPLLGNKRIVLVYHTLDKEYSLDSNKKMNFNVSLVGDVAKVEEVKLTKSDVIAFIELVRSEEKNVRALKAKLAQTQNLAKQLKSRAGLLARLTGQSKRFLTKVNEKRDEVIKDTNSIRSEFALGKGRNVKTEYENKLYLHYMSSIRTTIRALTEPVTTYLRYWMYEAKGLLDVSAHQIKAANVK